MILNLCKLSIVVLLAYSVGVIYWKTRHIPFTKVKNYLLMRRRIQGWMLVCTFVYALFVFAGYNMTKNDYKQAVITLNYTEASKAQNANGTRFDMSEIICNEVVERAVEKGGFRDIRAKDLKKCLYITPVVQGDSSAEELYHIATEFRLTYRADEKTAKLNAENVVKLIGDSFREFYIEKYADDFSAITFQTEDEEMFEDMDYPDIVRYLQKKSMRIINYMYALANENSGFVSSDGETFNSVATKVENINTEQIENNLKAIISGGGVSKDKTAYLNRLEYTNNILDYDAQKMRASYDTRNEAVSMYAADMTRVVLVPTLDQSDEFYMGRTKVGIDALSVEAQNYSKQSEDLYKEMETNRDIAEKLRVSAYAGGSDESLDKMISAINDDLNKYATRAARIGQEYSASRLNSCVTVNTADHSFMKKAMHCVVFSMMFLFSLFVLSIARTLKKTENITDCFMQPHEHNDKR